MATVKVSELAKSIGAPIEKLLKQIQEAGLLHNKGDDLISDEEKQRLLSFLEESHEQLLGKSKKITLQRKTTTTKSGAGGTRKKVNVEARKKNTIGNNFNREELTLKLEKVAARNRPAVSLFAARCVLRVIPLIAQDQLFNYWMGVGQYDKRAHYLLALWRGILSAWVYDEVTANKNASLANDAASALAATPWKLAADIATAASYVNASVHMSIDAAGYAIHFARLAILNSPQLIDFDKATKDDLRLIENSVPFEDVSLWIELAEHSKYAQLLNEWKNAIATLADQDEKENFNRSDLIQKIAESHQKMYNGEYSNAEAEYFLLEINSYFETDKTNVDLNTDKNQQNKEFAAIIDENPEEILQTIQYTASLQQSGEATSKEDHLDRQQLINALAAILAHRSNNDHRTIGLLGDWGSGKSTWLDFLKDALKRTDQPFLFGDFNAWAYEHTPNLQAGIAQEMIKALISPPSNKNFLMQQWWKLKLKVTVAVEIHGWPKIFVLLLKFLTAILPASLLSLLIIPLLTFNNSVTPTAAATTDEIKNILVLASGFISSAFLLQKLFWSELKNIVASPHAIELLTYLRLPDYAKHLGEIPVMRTTLEKFCRVRLKNMQENNYRMLFVVDDLDRCTPDGIVKVLEAVRLILGIENVTVIIAVDQHIALAALALHYKDLAIHHKLANPRSIARDYLAKVIHLPIILTNPKDNDIKNYLEKLWANTTPQKMLNTRKDVDIPLIKKFENVDEESLALTENRISNVGEERHEASTIAAKPEPDTATKEKRALDTESTKAAAKVEKVIGLTKDQKSAFIKWVNYFELTNPRQLKRLNNTYSLMLNADSNLDKASANETFKNTLLTDIKSYPILIALITMEYLNALDNQPLRKILKTRLQGLEIVEEFDSKGEKKITATFNTLVTEEFISFFTQLSTETNKNLIKIVEPFVLPAIEC